MTNPGIIPLHAPLAVPSGTATAGQVPVATGPRTAAWGNPPATKYAPAVGGYNLGASAMRKFRAAMTTALSGSTNAHIVVYGDSISAGVGATSAITTSWPARLRAMIDAKAGATRGTGFVSIYHATITGGPSTTPDSRLVLSGTMAVNWGQMSNYGPMAGTNGNSTGGIWYCPFNASAGTLTFGPVTADSFTVYYLKKSDGGTWTVTIDGGAPSSGGSSFSTVNASISVASATFTPASQGSHTLVLTGPTASGFPTVIGVEARANTASGGVRLSTIANAGMRSQGFDTGALGDVAGGQLSTEFDMLAPDLSIIMLIDNDSNSNINTAIASYKSYLQHLITRARQTGDVLLCTAPQQGATVPAPITLPSYTQALYELCDTNDIGLVDIGARWGAYGTLPGLYSDTYHPNDKGHYDIGATIYQALASCGVGL